MKIVIVGATGFIGRKLTEKLLEANHHVIVLSRRERSVPAMRQTSKASPEWMTWDGRTPEALIPAMDGASAILNLAGEPIAGKRWSAAQKIKILESRTATTRALVSAAALAARPPKVLLNASAVGFYGNVPEDRLTESSPQGTGFLADVCGQWEREAARVKEFGVRVVLLRSGIVLDAHAGALVKFLLPFRFFLGGHFGSGRQWFPWIHERDEINAILFAMEQENISGPLNLCAPAILRQKDFCTVLGDVLHRPSAVAIPGVVLTMMLGEMAGPLLLEGQNAEPRKLIDAGFRFAFPECEEALKDLLRY
jgi:uncharacterized protein (TIGR01777 family)